MPGKFADAIAVLQAEADRMKVNAEVLQKSGRFDEAQWTREKARAYLEAIVHLQSI